MTELESKFIDAMTSINDKLSDVEGKISAVELKLASVETKLDNDFRVIHGNGQPGLEQKFNDLERDVSNLRTELDAKSSYTLWILNSVAWLISFGLAVFNFINARGGTP